jgi:phosphatidylethanolamine/phosphatidyl-N-methylethanolamine N-methyltransferase
MTLSCGFSAGAGADRLLSWTFTPAIQCSWSDAGLSDFEFVPRDVEVTAVDLTPAMLRRATDKIGDRHIRLVEMDAMDLRFPDSTFDKTVLHLILAVVPDPVEALREAERVTKPNGLLVVLDKFWNRPTPPPLPLRMANTILGGYVTTVDRNFHAILGRTSLELLQEIPLAFGGLYLLYLLRKPGAEGNACRP